MSFWRESGLNVDYFVDNNPDLLGKRIDNVEVISAEKIRRLPEDTEIFITCRDAEMVLKQVEDFGIKKEKIKKLNTIIYMVGHALSQPTLNLPVKRHMYVSDIQTSKTIFDLSAGLVLGGIECWSIQTSEKIEKMGLPTALLVHNRPTAQQKIERKKIIPVSISESMTEWDKLNRLISVIMREGHPNIICNFASYHFAAACLAKRLFPDNIRVIAVMHNDEEIYYEAYTLLEQYIDKCLIISGKMRLKLVNKGFPEEKLRYLPWEIPCDDELHHTYSQENEAIRIGYAGRIVVTQKRSDYLVYIVKKLRERNVRFRLDIAGVGTFEDTFKAEVRENNFQGMVHFQGVVLRSEMKSFWNRQDIMVSCSEWEGHSISQCEAMAAGAVPIVTDVSGARDDIEDGENGFVVEVGAVDQIVEKICFLYVHRELLVSMGEKAHKTIKHKNNGSETERFWKDILAEDMINESCHLCDGADI